MKPVSVVLIAGFFAVLTLWCQPAKATQVVGVNMSDLMQANVAFTGTCTGADARVMDEPGGKSKIPVTTYTFSVSSDNILKGDVPGTFSFTQLGVSRAEARRLGTSSVMGMPSYEVGKEYTLFLTSASELGLRSTIGLGQGKFNVTTTQDGKKQVVNDRGNKGLFLNLPQTKAMSKALGTANISAAVPPAGGPVDYDAFVKMVRELEKGE
ncbi:MAG: hypothetical protein V2A66_00665 [Pseudomonadota bacterium]